MIGPQLDIICDLCEAGSAGATQAPPGSQMWPLWPHDTRNNPSSAFSDPQRPQLASQHAALVVEPARSQPPVQTTWQQAQPSKVPSLSMPAMLQSAESNDSDFFDHSPSAYQASGGQLGANEFAASSLAEGSEIGPRWHTSTAQPSEAQVDSPSAPREGQAQHRMSSNLESGQAWVDNNSRADTAAARIAPVVASEPQPRPSGFARQAAWGEPFREEGHHQSSYAYSANADEPSLANAEASQAVPELPHPNQLSRADQEQVASAQHWSDHQGEYLGNNGMSYASQAYSQAHAPAQFNTYGQQPYGSSGQQWVGL